MSKSLERRAILRGAGVAGATMVGVAAVPEAASAHDRHDHHGHGLLGAWHITHTDDPPSGAVGTALVTFSAGGVITIEEMPDGTLGLGAWRSDGHRLHARFFESQAGNGSEPSVVTEVRPRGHVHDDHIVGTYTATVRTTDDTVLQTITGRFTGERINA